MNQIWICEREHWLREIKSQLPDKRILQGLAMRDHPVTKRTSVRTSSSFLYQTTMQNRH